MDSADRHVRYRQRDKCGVIGMKPDLSGGKSNSMRGFKDCWGCADADRNNSRNKPRVCGEPYAATNGTYWFRRGDTGDPVKRATGPYLTLRAPHQRQKASVPKVSGLLEDPVHTRLIPAIWLEFRKEGGSVACRDLWLCKRKSSIFWVVSAKRVWSSLHWLNSSPSGLVADASER